MGEILVPKPLIDKYYLLFGHPGTNPYNTFTIIIIIDIVVIIVIIINVISFSFLLGLAGAFYRGGGNSFSR